MLLFKVQIAACYTNMAWRTVFSENMILCKKTKLYYQLCETHFKATQRVLNCCDTWHFLSNV